MERLLVIDSCMRPESRTRKILEAAKEALASRYEIESIDVNAAGLLPITPEVLAERTSGIVPEPIVALARKIAAADRLVVAAPFWDMSFPAALKTFNAAGKLMSQKGDEFPCSIENILRKHVPFRCDFH